MSQISISTQNHIDAIRSNLMVATKVQLHTGNPMFEDFPVYGVYRTSGGKNIGSGSVGPDFEPADLNIILDAIINSADQCGSGIYIDLDTLKYTEYKGGKIVSLSVSGQPIEVKSPLVGDVLQTRYHFLTGFDGSQSASLSFDTLRLTCMNGARNWRTDVSLKYKNTKGNQGKSALMFCDSIQQVQAGVKEYGEFLNAAAAKKVTRAKMNQFFKALLGYSQDEYNDLKKQQQARLDAINACVATEERDLKMSLYTLLQGVTRFTTHDLAGGNLDKIMTDTPMEMNRKAHRLIYEMAN